MQSKSRILVGICISLLSCLFRCLILLFSFSVFSTTICSAKGMGPLHAINRVPTHLMFLTPVPTAPADPAYGRLQTELDIDYARIFFSNRSTHWQTLADMEMTVVTFSLEYQLSRRFWIGAGIPIAGMNSGILDDFVEGFHETFGLPNNNRCGRSKNEFGYLLRKDGRDWISAKSGGFHLADSRVSLRMALLRNTSNLPLNIDLQYLLKLPLGSADAGFGSGRFDHGLFLPMQLNSAPWSIYFMPGWILPAPPDTLGADVAVNPMGAAFLGVEYAPSPGLSLLGQVNFYTSPLETTGIRQLDQDSMELVLGISGQITSGTVLEMAFSEDLTRNAPDFSVHIGMKLRAF